jgi:gliding motility-associated-like protein
MLIATTLFGCSDTAYSYIQVLEELIYYVPNSFTPDGDIFNQTFQPVFTSGFDPFNYNLRIFNRWGAVIFESADPATGWDGSYTLNGNVLPCQSGVYTWKIEFKSPENDEKQVINGHVSLLR